MYTDYCNGIPKTISTAKKNKSHGDKKKVQTILEIYERGEEDFSGRHASAVHNKRTKEKKKTTIAQSLRTIADDCKREIDIIRV